MNRAERPLGKRERSLELSPGLVHLTEVPQRMSVRSQHPHHIGMFRSQRTLPDRQRTRQQLSSLDELSLPSLDLAEQLQSH